MLALLSFIADAKPDNVIFAMEEPEIALPPHTQRRIANYLLNDTAQCFVSSHSPYVIERFAQEQIHILRRDNAGTLTSTTIDPAKTLNPNHYKRHARRGVAEALLGAAVIVAEGVTEHSALQAVASKLEASNNTLWPLDLAGVTIFSVDGDGDIANFGGFFKGIGLKTFAFYDKKQRKQEKNQQLAANFIVPRETAYTAIEKLLVAEIPVARQWQMLKSLRDAGTYSGIPQARPSDDEVRRAMQGALGSNKGNGFAAALIELCAVVELPASVADFLKEVYAHFPKPQRPAVLPPIAPAAPPPPVPVAPSEATTAAAAAATDAAEAPADQDPPVRAGGR